MITCPHTSKSSDDVNGKKVVTEYPFTLEYRNTLGEWIEKGLKAANEGRKEGEAPVALTDKQKAAIAVFTEAFPNTNHQPKANDKGFISRDEASKTVHPVIRPIFSEVFHGHTLTQQVSLKSGGEFAAIDNEDLLDACKSIRKIKDDKGKYSTDWIIKKAQAMLAE